MNLRNVHATYKWTLLGLTLLLQACASTSPDLPVVVAPPVIPALPQAAKQPQVPAWCTPTCSAKLSSDLSSWQSSLIEPTQPGLRVKPRMPQ